MEEQAEYKTKGGRPAAQENEKLEHRISVRFSKSDQVKLKLKAKKANMKTSDYIRQAAINGTIKRPPSPEEVKFYRDLSGMANNLNQLTKEAHQQKLSAIAPLILTELNKIHKILSDLDNKNENR